MGSWWLFWGDAELCGICEEGALTFKEICQVDSNYYHLLDARHLADGDDQI